MIKNQFPIDLAGSQGGVIGSNESFEKSHENNYEHDAKWKTCDKKTGKVDKNNSEIKT